MTDIVLKAQEEILFLHVSDEALEVAAGAAKVHSSFTLVPARACLSARVDRPKCVRDHSGRDRREAVSLFWQCPLVAESDIAYCDAHVRF